MTNGSLFYIVGSGGPSDYVPAPHFPGWVLVGWNDTVLESDVMVMPYRAVASNRTPETGFSGHGWGTKTTAEIIRITSGERNIDTYCFYRKEWTQLDPSSNEKVLNGDLCLASPETDPSQYQEAKAGHYDNGYHSFTIFVSSTVPSDTGWTVMSLYDYLKTLRPTTDYTFWRKAGTESPPSWSTSHKGHRSNDAFAKPLPLP